MRNSQSHVASNEDLTQAACFWKEVLGSLGYLVCIPGCCGGAVTWLPKSSMRLLPQRTLLYSIHHLMGSSRAWVNADTTSPSAADRSECSSFDSFGFTDGRVHRLTPRRTRVLNECFHECSRSFWTPLFHNMVWRTGVPHCHSHLMSCHTDKERAQGVTERCSCCPGPHQL